MRISSPTFKGNGMALDLDGNLLVCEQVASCVVRFAPDGTRELVAFHYRGEYLNSPNDVVTRGSDGSIYFTDPDYGRWNDWIGQRARAALGSASRASTGVPPGGGEPQLVVGRGRVRRAERAVLLAGRDAAVRQRLAARAHQGVRRRRRRVARATGRHRARRHRHRRCRRATSTGWSATSTGTSG